MPKMGRKLVLGIDEAGYGPSMGPFVIVATAWRVPRELHIESLAELLSPEIQSAPLRSWGTGKSLTHIPLGDSKKIYAGKLAWESLSYCAQFLLWLECITNQNKEREKISVDTSVLTSTLPNHQCPLSTVEAQLYPLDFARIKTVPWFHSLVLPKRMNPREENGSCSASASSATSASPAEDAAFAKLKALDVELVASRGRLVDEMEWNRLVSLYQNKSSVLSELSLSLAKELATMLMMPNEPVEIYCDKHGGRNRYHSLLMHAFDDQWFDTLAESSKLSRYATRWGSNSLMIQFRVEGDSLVPSAAASILAKWTRELAMKSLNDFWSDKATNTGATPPKPTAGYYVDAMRFARDVHDLAEQHGPPKSDWWRVK